LEELADPAIRSKAPHAFEGHVPLVDRWLFARLAETIKTVNAALESYRFHEAAQNVYQFFWGDFCDWYIEWVKPDLLSEDRATSLVAWKNLFAGFEAALRLLHPFMPFLTEELWHQLPQKSGAKSIGLGTYPEARAEWKDAAALAEFGLVQETIQTLRTLRAEMKLDKRKVAAEFASADAKVRATVQANLDGIVRLGLLTELKVLDGKLAEGGGGKNSTAQFDLRIPYVAEAIDVGAELARIRKEIDRLTKDIAGKEGQLGNETFRSRAPERIIQGLEATLAERRVELRKCQERVKELEKQEEKEEKG
jgi:valyl-tRNA synthetase